MTIAVMSYLNNPGVGNIYLQRNLWIGSLTVEIWVIIVATISPMALGGCLGEQASKLMSSEVVPKGILQITGWLSMSGAVAVLVMAWGFYFGERGTNAIPLAIMFTVLYPALMVAPCMGPYVVRCKGWLWRNSDSPNNTHPAVILP